MSISDSSPELHSWINRCSETLGWAPYRYGFCCVKSLTKLRRLHYNTLSKWRPVAWIFWEPNVNWLEMVANLANSVFITSDIGWSWGGFGYKKSELRVRMKSLNV